MSETLFPPFLKWGKCKSKDENNPDVLNFEALETDTFETEYSINVKALKESDGEWNETIIPLQSFESKNKQLYTLWLDAIQSNKITAGKKILNQNLVGNFKEQISHKKICASYLAHFFLRRV